MAVKAQKASCSSMTSSSDAAIIAMPWQYLQCLLDNSQRAREGRTQCRDCTRRRPSARGSSCSAIDKRTTALCAHRLMPSSSILLKNTLVGNVRSRSLAICGRQSTRVGIGAATWPTYS